MGTTLQAQLARITAESSDPLNLKAHKKAYAQSLLFQPDVAAQQSTDALFDICHEGFQELCSLDHRFQPFAKTIFSEQSKTEDRSQLTAARNQELDRALESFLSLVGPRLLLKPALKAVEWLIRHFRVHQMNTAHVLYTFLPYHTLPHFATLLSILPKALPPHFHFLAPYQAQPASPPRQEIVYAASRKASFWCEWSVHVLHVCRQGYHYHNMVAYWAAAATESLVSQIENASRGNRASEQQKVQDIVLNVLPIVNDALLMTHIQDARISALMLLTVLASKTALADQTLGKTMEAVVEHATKETRDAELICLAVLAQKRSTHNLPRKILRFLCSIESLGEDLSTLSEQYDIGRLVLGIIQGAARNKLKNLSAVSPAFIEWVLNHRLMTEEQIQLAIADILKAAQELSAETPEPLREWLTESLRQISESATYPNSLPKALEVFDGDVHQLERSLQLTLDLSVPDREIVSFQDDSSVQNQPESYVQAVLDRVPKRTVDETSFLTADNSHVFPYLAQAFTAVIQSNQPRSSFINLPLFQRDSERNTTLLLSFFLRIICEHHASPIRASALLCAVDCMKEAGDENHQDRQVVIPYIVYALSDLSVSVRSAAIALITKIGSARNGQEKMQETNGSQMIRQQSYYGQEKDSDISWLSTGDAQAVYNEILLPHLEEFRSDHSFISQVLAHSLVPEQANGQPRPSVPAMKLSQKENIFNFLLGHVAQAPLLTLGIRILSVLRPVEKVGHTSKFKRLTSLVLSCQRLSDVELADYCSKGSAAPLDYASAIVNTISPRDRSSLKALEDMLKDPKSIGSDAFRSAALNRLQEIWLDLKSGTMANLTQVLFEHAAIQDSKEHSRAKTAYLDTLRQLPLSAVAIATLLEQLPKISTLTQSVKPSPKRRKLNQTPSADENAPKISEARRQITITLELAEASSQGTSPALISPLFELLGDLHQIKDSDQSIEYTQTLLMDLLNKAVLEATANATPIDRRSLRVDLVVEYFRHSDNTQLQQASLLLMSSLAAVAPDEVVHNIMPVFTFMGSTILRQSDEFSMHVIEKTIESVIPPLVASLQKDKRGPLAGISELVLSFVAAFEHIAPHRRQELFALLVDKIDPQSFLFVFLTILVDKHGNGRDIVDFAVDLAARYSPMVQMTAISGCFDAMSDGLQKKPTMAKHIFSLERYPDNQATVLAISQLVDRWMSSQQLTSSITKTLRKSDSEVTRLQKSFARLLEQTLRFLGQASEAKSLDQRSHVLLQHLLALFPLEHSIKSVSELLRTGDNNLRYQVLKSLETQISSQKASSQSARTACLEFLPELQSILSEDSTSQLKRASISCIDRIAEKFGKASPGAVSATIEEVFGSNGLASEDSQLRSISLLCLTTMVEVLEDGFIPNVPHTLPACLSILEKGLQTHQLDEGLASAAWAFVSALLLYLPYILTGEYLDGVLRIAFEGTAAASKSKTANTSKNAVALISSQVASQECFSALGRTWSFAESKGVSAVKLHLWILDSTVEKVSKATAVRLSSNISALCLLVMDLRRIKALDPLYSDADILDVEMSLNETITKMIYKLNDKCFRPIFARMVEWSNDESIMDTGAGKTARQTALFGFAAHFFETLKSIVTSYSGFIVEGATEVLKGAEPTRAESALLWNRAISTLTASFEHDQDELWQSPARFGSVVPAVTGQLDRGTDPELASKAISCVSALATAADSPDNMKVINTAILERFRHRDHAIRLTAVKCEQALTERLGEEWLGLLPEMLPFISEAMEDDDDQVETETRRWVGQIEEILGESLDPMLQ